MTNKDSLGAFQLMCHRIGCVLIVLANFELFLEFWSLDLKP
jgi:hypothetical protein